MKVIGSTYLKKVELTSRIGKGFFGEVWKIKEEDKREDKKVFKTLPNGFVCSETFIYR